GVPILCVRVRQSFIPTFLSCFLFSASCWSVHYRRMGNGAKAQQRRERNAEKGAAKGSKSQAKVNEAAKSIVCNICRQAFLVTTRAPAYVASAIRSTFRLTTLPCVLAGLRSMHRTSTPKRWRIASLAPQNNTHFLVPSCTLPTYRPFSLGLHGCILCYCQTGKAASTAEGCGMSCGPRIKAGAVNARTCTERLV
ncbi:hypothetical protein BC834DRAFT_1006780, partial [Gloeopeniophorella convolvens]